MVHLLRGRCPGPPNSEFRFQEQRMSLTSPRIIFPSIVLALASLMVASCGQQNLPTSPSLTTALTGLQGPAAEYFMELADPTPPPSGVERYTLLDEPGPPPAPGSPPQPWPPRSEEHTSELQSLRHLVCRLLV